jgi:hypothetical protein
MAEASVYDPPPPHIVRQLINPTPILKVTLGTRVLDPDPDGSALIWAVGSGSAIRKKAGSGSVSGSALNQCGSETLLGTVMYKNTRNNEQISIVLTFTECCFLSGFTLRLGCFICSLIFASLYHFFHTGGLQIYFMSLWLTLAW